MDTLDAHRVRRFFDAVNARFACARDMACFVVTHILPDRPFFLAALGSLAQLGVVLAKPRSIDSRTKGWLTHRHPLIVLRERFTDQSAALELASRFGGNRPLILLDIGGYFASVMHTLAAGYAGGLLGAVEDTENGIQRYEREPSLACPVISVARSPLKNPEDFLVGQSIVYSVEALLRQQGDILHGRTACVIGYGKFGRSIANLLHVRTVVFDVDAVRQIEAMSHGFSIAHRLDGALRGAGPVFCATGNIALRREAFALLDNGAYVATVTSSDDELEIGDLHRDYRMKQVTDFLTAYSKGGRIFYLMNRGQAVNFIHGATVGPFIYLIQAELLASVARLSTGALAPGIGENDEGLRRAIAEIWLDHFGPQAGGEREDA